MASKSTSNSWSKTRAIVNKVHLWIGLVSGIIIFLICFSGTIYTYNTEIRELASPHLHYVKEAPEKKDINDLIQSIESKQNGVITSVSIPYSPTRSYALTVKPPNDKSRFGVTYYLNPYTGKILGNSKVKTKTDEFMGYLFSLHRWLLLDKIETPIFQSIENRKLGSYISGTATILFTFGLITGMVIWFPRKVKNWRQGLKIKFTSNWKRLNHDLHNSLSFYALFFLLLMSLTGPQWSFDWYRTGLRKTLGTHQEPSLKKGNKAIDNKKDIELLPINSYLTAAQSSIDYNGDLRISFPKTPTAPVEVNVYKTGFLAPSAADKIIINRFDGSVINVELFKDKPFNERVSASIKSLHLGNVYGQFSKLIYFLACLIATSLPVTGTLIWINKMKKTKKRPSKKKASRNKTIDAI